MNGAGNNEAVERVQSQAVLALTQLMTLYLAKSEGERWHPSERAGAPVFRKGREFEIQAPANVFARHALGSLQYPEPSSLKNGMRAIGAALYEETNSVEVMSDVLYRVMEHFPHCNDEVIRILDHAFDGIGGWWA